MVVSDNFEYNLLGLQISTYNADRLRRISNANSFSSHIFTLYKGLLSEGGQVINRNILSVLCWWSDCGQNNLIFRYKNIDIIKTKPWYGYRNKISGYINVILLIWISVSLVPDINCDWVGLNCQSRKHQTEHFITIKMFNICNKWPKDFLARSLCKYMTFEFKTIHFCTVQLILKFLL